MKICECGRIYQEKYMGQKRCLQCSSHDNPTLCNECNKNPGVVIENEKVYCPECYKKLKKSREDDA